MAKTHLTEHKERINTVTGIREISKISQNSGRIHSNINKNVQT